MYAKLVIVGYLGRDPEIKYLPTGTPVTNLNVATSNVYKDAAGTKVEETTWYRVSVFGKAAEACAEYLAKGRLVLVEGRLRPDKATGGPRLYDKKDGSKGASFEVVANTVKFLGGGSGKSTAEGETDQSAEAPTAINSDVADESIPF